MAGLLGGHLPMGRLGMFHGARATSDERSLFVGADARPSMDDLPPKLSAFTDELRRNHRALWYVAMSVVANAADADDVLQEASIVAIRKVDDFAPGSSFRAWMGEIVRNVALNRRRRSKRELKRFGTPVDPERLDLPARAAPHRPVHEAGALLPTQEALDDSMRSALMQLEPVARACVLLRCIEGLEYEQISQLLAIPKGTAMSHVFRCRRQLASLLTPSPSQAR